MFGNPAVDSEGPVRSSLNNLQRLIEADMIYVWASAGLKDQLLILFIVYLVALSNVNPTKVRVVQYESHASSISPV